jgi:hypothetical protein|tara:strand:- start:1446 stop:1634 length:189 start_codon:yes stop_codon:yes gene_type:complete
MRDRLELIIEELKLAMADVDKVECGSYGYKAAAPRARKAALTAIKELKELRAEIQQKKNSHE